MTVNNSTDGHRIRLLLPGQESCGFTVSDNQFGSIKRPVYDEAMKVWEKENWSERPDSIYPFLSYVSAGGKGLCVITDSVREYEMVGENYDTLAITLIRCVGVLGKEKLFRRPGRPSGIKMETPDSQLHGSHTFRLGITGDHKILAEQAKEYLTPLISYNKMQYHAMKLNPASVKTPWSYSLLKTEKKYGPILSTLKKAEEGKNLIARFFNPHEQKETVKIVDSSWKMIKEVKLDEAEVIKNCENQQSELMYDQVKTFVLEK